VLAEPLAAAVRGSLFPSSTPAPVAHAASSARPTVGLRSAPTSAAEAIVAIAGTIPASLRPGGFDSGPSKVRAVVPAAVVPAWKVTLALPAASGTGRRIVYSAHKAHVWVLDADGTVLRDYKVTGRADRPKAGTYRIYSKSLSAINPGEKLRFDLMVRFAHGVTGVPIGFHTIPRSYAGVPIQRESQLGRAVGMGGCVRQSRADATWLYRWSKVGDTVVVVY